MCTNSKSPSEIINIINEINSTPKIIDANKKIAIQNLQSAIYFPDNSKLAKSSMYFAAESNIRQDPEFIKAGINNKIADEIDSFIKQNIFL